MSVINGIECTKDRFSLYIIGQGKTKNVKMSKCFLKNLKNVAEREREKRERERERESARNEDIE